MINVVLGITSFLLLLLGLLYPSSLLLFSVKPDLALILIIFLSLYSRSQRTFFWAVFLGGLKDFLSVDLFGINILSFSLISIILGTLEARFFFREKTSTVFVFALSVSLANIIIVNFLHSLFATAQYSFFILLRILILQSISTAIWSIPIIYLLKKCALEFSIFQSS